MNIAETTKETIKNAADKTKQVTSETSGSLKIAWRDFSRLTVDKKEEAVDFLYKQSIALDQQIEKLNKDVDGLSDDAKKSAQDSLDSLKAKKAELGLQIEKTKNATSETWSELSLETQKKWNGFTESLHELRERMRRSS